MLESYVQRLERDLHSGVLHLMVLSGIGRHGPIHGYGLIKAMSEAAGGRDLFKEGTIYPLLADYEREGLVRSRWGQGESGPRRKYYELTSLGQAALRLATNEWTRVKASLEGMLTNGKRSAKP